MKKTLFALALLAALMFCSCNNALGPNEEPLIRAGGIIDRIYLTSEDHPEKNTYCTITFDENQLVLMFDKVSSFTLSIWNNNNNVLAFGQKYKEVSSCIIDFSDFEDGSYTLFIDNSFLCQFNVKDGSYVEQNLIDIVEKEIKWYEGESMFVEVKYSLETPELDFSSSIYPYSTKDWEGWPFGKVEQFSTSLTYRGGESIEDSTLYIGRDSILRERWHFSLGTEFILRTTTHGSFSPEYAPSDVEEELQEESKPRLSGQTLKYDGKDLDDLWTSYTRGLMLPSEFKDFTKQEDENGNITYVTEMPVAIQPATAPYLIEFIDKTNTMVSIKHISVEGFAAQYSLSVCEPIGIPCTMSINSILPVKHIEMSDETTANVAAAKLRTWGRAVESTIVLKFTATFENGSIETLSTDITDQVAAQSKGGLVTIFIQ